MENIANIDGNEIGMAIIPLLWVFGLMAVCVVAYVGKKMNEKDRQRIGAELELIKDYHFSSAPNEAIVTWLRKKGLEAKEAAWNSENEANATKVVSDGSLNTGGFEIVSPPLADGDHVGWFTKIAKAIRGLAKPDTSCGYHVHIGLKDSGSRWGDGQIDRHEAQRIAGRVAYGYGYFQSAFNALVSRSRRGTASYIGSNTFMVSNEECTTKKVLVNRDWDEDGEVIVNYSTDPKVISERHYVRAADAGRYVNLNVESISKHGTIEFRQHQGTANATKGVAWADLCYLFVQRCSDFATWQTCEEYPDNIDGLMQFIGLSVDDDLRHYWTKRAAVLDGSLRTLNRARGLVTIKACEYCEQIACEGQCETGVDSLDADMVEHFAHSPAESLECVNCGYETLSGDIEDLSSLRYVGELDDTARSGYCEMCEEHTHFRMAGGLLLTLIMGVSPLVLMAAVIVNCGIGAIHRGLQRKANRKRLAHLWRGLESRGGQAAGVGWVNEDDTKNLWYLKHPQTATSLAPSLKKHFTKETVYAMLHTRFATHGKNDSANAHPHFGPNAKVMMVHNGVVHNHEDVWDALNIKETGPVDSQAIAACLEIGGVEEVVKHCEGSMSLIWTDRRDPHGTLKCWTNGGNPLVMGRLDDAVKGAVVIASTEAILSEAMGKRLKTIWDCSIGREYTINPNGNISKRDIKDSAETADTYFSWRNYGDLKKTNTNYRSIGKPKYDSYNYKQLGIDPERDNCELVEDTVSSADEDQAYALMEGDGSWAAFNGFHGYCSQTHEGISPDGDYYQLDSTVHYITDMKRILAGAYQPETLDWNGVEWSDLDLAQEQINLERRDYDTF